MQRRAAAFYFAFFVIVGAAAFGLIETTSAPEVSVQGETLEEGDSVPLGDRTFELASASQLTWENESARQTATIDNGSEVPVTDVTWDGQEARTEATFEAGSTVEINGTEYDVSTNASAGSVTLTRAGNESVNETHAVGDTFDFRGYEATVTEVAEAGALVVYGGPYVLAVNNESVSNPTNATLLESPDYDSLAAADPALYDETVTVNGTLAVVERDGDTTVPVTEYFGERERHLVEENGTLGYQGNETDVVAVGNETVELAWTQAENETISLTEGENVTVDGTQYFAHFPDDSSVRIFETAERWDDYSSQQAEVSSYESRILGLWGVVIVSIIAGIVLIATAFLPVRG